MLCSSKNASRTLSNLSSLQRHQENRYFAWVRSKHKQFKAKIESAKPELHPNPWILNFFKTGMSCLCGRCLLLLHKSLWSIHAQSTHFQGREISLKLICQDREWSGKGKEEGYYICLQYTAEPLNISLSGTVWTLKPGQPGPKIL